VIHRAEERYYLVGHGRYLAEHIDGARYVELPGADHHFYAGDQEAILGEIQAFLTGVRGDPDFDRVLATVLFTDIVSSTDRAAELGDRRWRTLLDAHDRLIEAHISQYRGRRIKTTGDGVLATFDGPARAIRCALALADEIGQRLGVEIRAGLHTGEIELRDHDIGGIAVALAARVMAEAGPGQVLVSGAVPPLVAGSGLEFDDLGSRVLKGVPGEWRLHAVKP
jgi:class 3 adenylate cyclase